MGATHRPLTTTSSERSDRANCETKAPSPNADLAGDPIAVARAPTFANRLGRRPETSPALKVLASENLAALLKRDDPTKGDLRLAVSIVQIDGGRAGEPPVGERLVQREDKGDASRT